MQISDQATGFSSSTYFLHVGKMQTRSVLFLLKHLLWVLFLENHVIV